MPTFVADWRCIENKFKWTCIFIAVTWTFIAVSKVKLWGLTFQRHPIAYLITLLDMDTAVTGKLNSQGKLN